MHYATRIALVGIFFSITCAHVAESCDTTAPDRPDLSLLTDAFDWGDTKDFSGLLSEEALRTKNKGGQTLLHRAAHDGHEDLVRAIITMTTDSDRPDQQSLFSPRQMLINSQNQNGDAPLHLAAAKGHTSIVDLLIQSKAIINAANKNKETPLLLALSNGHEATALCLIKAGAACSVTAECGKALIHLALDHNFPEVLNQLLFHMPLLPSTRTFLCKILTTPKKTDHDKIAFNTLIKRSIEDQCEAASRTNSLLHTAAKLGNGEAVRLLLDLQHDADPINAAGETPLSMALSHNHEAIALTLIKANAARFASPAYGQRLVTLALEHNLTKALNQLIPLALRAASLSINITEALETTLSEADKTTLKKLIQSAVDKETKEGQANNSLLHIAAKLGFEEAVRLLLDLQHDAAPINAEGETPLSMALSHNHEAIALTLIKACPATYLTLINVPKILHWFSTKASQAAHEELLLLIPIGKSPDSSLGTELQKVPEGKRNAILTFVQAVACFQRKNPDEQNSFLHIAAMCSNNGMTKKLLKMKHPPYCRNAKGETPLACALSIKSEKVALTLIRHDPSLIHWAEKGKTLIELALNNNLKQALIELLPMLLHNDSVGKALQEIVKETTPAEEAFTRELILSAFTAQEESDLFSPETPSLNAIKLLIWISQKPGSSIPILAQAHEQIACEWIIKGWANDTTTKFKRILLEQATKNELYQVSLELKYLLIADSVVCETLRSAWITTISESQKDAIQRLISSASSRNKENRTKTEMRSDLNAIVIAFSEESELHRFLDIAITYGNTEAQAFKLAVTPSRAKTESNRETLLYSMLSDGHTAVASALIRAGADINHQDSCKNSMLHNFILANKQRAVLFLIEEKANLNIKNAIGLTPLDLATQHKGEEIATALLNAGAQTSIIGESKLHKAADKGDTESLIRLLKSGAIVHQKNKQGQTPLHLAAINGHHKIAKILLDNGANPLTTNNNDKTPFGLALERKCIEVIMLLAEQIPSSFKLPDGRNILHRAAEIGDAKMFTAFIKRYPDIINAQCHKMKTPLHYAASRDHFKIVEILLANEANFFITDDEGKTPINLLSFSQSIAQETLSLILTKYPELINSIDRNGSNLVNAAVINKDSSILAKWVELGADKNSKDKDGNTPLLNATRSAAHSIRPLLTLGVNVNETNKEKQTALMIAISKRNREAFDRLIEAEAQVKAPEPSASGPIHIAVENANQIKHDAVSKYFIEKLIEKDTSILNESDHLGRTALYIALEKEHYFTAKILVTDKVDIDIRPKGKRTILESALLAGDLLFLDHLLKLGANVNTQNSKGETPLHLAAQKDDANAARMLIAAKADPTLRDENDKTALGICKLRGKNTELAKILTEAEMTSKEQFLAEDL